MWLKITILTERSMQDNTIKTTEYKSTDFPLSPLLIRIKEVYLSKLSRVAFWGGHRSTPVKYKHMLFPPACSSPLITEDLPGSWPGRYMRIDIKNTVCMVPQSVQYHKLPSPRVLRPATSQARLHGVLGRRSMYGTFLKSSTTEYSVLYYLFPDVIIEDPDWVEEVLQSRMLHLRLQKYATKNTERQF
jgi:hypothetical protein